MFACHPSHDSSPGHFSAALPDLSLSFQLVVSALPFPVFIEPPRGWEKEQSRAALGCDSVMSASADGEPGANIMRKENTLSQTADGVMKPIGTL